MTLALAEFEGFKLDAAMTYLRGFDYRTRQKGERYFRSGAVDALRCIEPGGAYSADVLGSETYNVTLICESAWAGECTCPVGDDCKHIYAAMKQLLAEHSRARVANLSATAGGISPRPVPVPTVPSALPPAPPSPPSRPGTFADLVREKVGRKLTWDESRYLNTIHDLFREAVGGGIYHQRDLSVLIPIQQNQWWKRIELYPTVPRTEREFWNYLALYLTEHARQTIPEFLRDVTDLATPREAMRRHFRARDIEQWKVTLSRMTDPLQEALAAERPTEAVELRARFLDDCVLFEWRLGAGVWSELNPRKADDFDRKYAPFLPAEAALIWQPLIQRFKVNGHGNSMSFSLDDSWMVEQIARWLRQPLLRPLLVDAQGVPLKFHAEPLQWRVTQPEDADGDYIFSLVQADGVPVPEIRMATVGHPAVYLTSLGVFNGPPFDGNVMSARNKTLIPAKAFESTDGLRLLQHLRVAPPPRLAGRIRNVSLRPGVRAEIKIPQTGTKTEYCHLDVYGASADGEHVECWLGNAWFSKGRAAGGARDRDFIQLDRSALRALIPPLEQAGFKWDSYSQRWQLRVTKKFAEIFVTFLKALPSETRIDLGGDLASFQNAEVAGRIRLEASEAETDWFDLRVLVDVNDATLTPEEIKLLLDAKGGWVRLGKKGWRKLEFKLSEEEDKELARLGLTPHELTSEPQRLHALQLADKAARRFLPGETCERIERRVSELQARVTPEVPAGIKADLRPYQRDGFHFLAYLSTNRFGGILADDMGLGKTVQALAWIEWLRSGTALLPGQLGDPISTRAGQSGGSPDGRDACPTTNPALVVCPKSVADNWHAEAGRFLPGLRVKAWSAAELKELPAKLAEADLHVINYNQLRLVGNALAGAKFLAVILDEGQYIKNPLSLTGQIARRLRAEHRLILSGTPIENRLLDLWSLMSFAMPGALGSRAEFGRLYDAKGDPFARQRLSARVRPFLIRRTKAQVARDLPDRIEEDLFCELEGEQKTLYRAELKRAQAMLLGIKTAAALSKQRFHFLTSLLRLRQICCHPKLVKPDSKAASAKIEALVETLEPLMDEGQKVLVFSQFVEMLELIRGELEKRGWKHWYLAGDTENRGDLVREFQSAGEAGAFLISLKAGGFGLNLTASSYVILFDPWWNPAVENQAIDRTHRIGQARKVIAYRLLIKDSIEEKIRALQRQKKGLAEDVLGEEKFSQSLSLDDLRYLLAE